MGIEFWNKEGWHAVNDNVTEAMVVDQRKFMSVQWRIWELACVRMNNWGHASFRAGELATLACGDDNSDNRHTVKRGIKKLADMGRIAPLEISTELCIVIHGNLVQRAKGKGGRNDICHEPSHEQHRDQLWPPKPVTETAPSITVAMPSLPSHEWQPIPGSRNDKRCNMCGKHRDERPHNLAA